MTSSPLLAALFVGGWLGLTSVMTLWAAEEGKKWLDRRR